MKLRSGESGERLPLSRDFFFGCTVLICVCVCVLSARSLSREVSENLSHPPLRVLVLLILFGRGWNWRWSIPAQLFVNLNCSFSCGIILEKGRQEIPHDPSFEKCIFEALIRLQAAQ